MPITSTTSNYGASAYAQKQAAFQTKVKYVQSAGTDAISDSLHISHQKGKSYGATGLAALI